MDRIVVNGNFIRTYRINIQRNIQTHNTSFMGHVDRQPSSSEYNIEIDIDSNTPKHLIDYMYYPTDLKIYHNGLVYDIHQPYINNTTMNYNQFNPMIEPSLITFDITSKHIEVIDDVDQKLLERKKKIEKLKAIIK